MEMKCDLDCQSVTQILKQHGQMHLLDFYEDLDKDKRRQLLDQIKQLDFSVMSDWIDKYVRRDVAVNVPETLNPAPFYPAAGQATDQGKYQQAVKYGGDLIAAGKVAGFVVAGGQGTRLGFEGPKGDFPVSPIRNKTLFRLFAETILAAEMK